MACNDCLVALKGTPTLETNPLTSVATVLGISVAVLVAVSLLWGKSR